MKGETSGPMAGRTRRSTLRLLGSILLTAAAFFFAIQLLSGAMQTLSPAIRPLLYEQASPSRMLAVSWLLTYVLSTGSVVAAIALSLFSAELIGVLELFLLVAGSRLGAAGIVVLIGGVDYLRIRDYSLREAVGLGTLAFVVTHSIYVPATVVGAAILRTDFVPLRGGVPPAAGLDGGSLLEPVTSAVVGSLGAVASVVLALVLVLSSLQLLDRTIQRFESDELRERVFVYLDSRWFSLGLGLLLTAVTTSIAFSMGVLVPIYNRGYLERNEVVPYMMGASLGTLSDTLLVALLLDSAAGLEIVLVLFAAASLTVLVLLAFYDSYYAVVETVQRRILEDRVVFAVFLASLVAVPLALLFVPA